MLKYQALVIYLRQIFVYSTAHDPPVVASPVLEFQMSVSCLAVSQASRSHFIIFMKL